MKIWQAIVIFLCFAAVAVVDRPEYHQPGVVMVQR